MGWARAKVRRNREESIAEEKTMTGEE